jgi:hypothetical protein
MDVAIADEFYLGVPKSNVYGSSGLLCGLTVECLQPETTFDGSISDFSIKCFTELSPYDSVITPSTGSREAYVRNTIMTETPNPAWVKIYDIDFNAIASSGWRLTSDLLDDISYTIMRMQVRNTDDGAAFTNAVDLPLRLTWSWLKPETHGLSINYRIASDSSAPATKTPNALTEAIVGMVGGPFSGRTTTYKSWTSGKLISDGFKVVRDVISQVVQDFGSNLAAGALNGAQLAILRTIPGINDEQWQEIIQGIADGSYSIEDVIAWVHARTVKQPGAQQKVPEYIWFRPYV